MPTRRQEKIARFLKEVVSDVIANHLNDPRIEGFVSVTRVEVTGDLRMAEVYLSVFGRDEAAHERTYIAIIHARSRIQQFVADAWEGKFCPIVHLHKDEKLKKTLETLKLIEKTAAETQEKNEPEKKDEDRQ